MADVSLLLTRGRVVPFGARRPEPLDIAVGADGRIAAMGPLIKEEVGAHKIIDVGDKLVVPGLVDAHQHLDKSRTRRLIANPTAS